MHSNIRTCRVCGFWIQEAGGRRGWAAADRCTACPADAAKTLPINAAHVRAVELQTVARAELPDDLISETFRGVEFPRLVVTTVTGPQGLPRITAFVGALTVPDPNDAAAIAALLNLPEAA